MFLSGAPKNTHWRRQLNWFKQKLREFEDAISPVWKLTPLDLETLLSHLASCINGRMCEIAVPRTPTYLDAILGNQDLIDQATIKSAGRVASAKNVTPDNRRCSHWVERRGGLPSSPLRVKASYFSGMQHRP